MSILFSLNPLYLWLFYVKYLIFRINVSAHTGGGFEFRSTEVAVFLFFWITFNLVNVMKSLQGPYKQINHLIQCGKLNLRKI